MIFLTEPLDELPLYLFFFSQKIFNGTEVHMFGGLFVFFFWQKFTC